MTVSVMPGATGGAVPAAATGGWRFALLPLGTLDRLRDQVDALFERAALPNPFFHPDFLGPSAAALGRGRVRLACLWSFDRLVFFAPVERLRFAPFIARLWTHASMPLGLPLCEPALARHVAAPLGEGLARAGVRVLALPDLPVELPLMRAFGEGAAAAGFRVLDAARAPRPVLHAHGPGARPLDALIGRERRRTLARSARRLADAGELRRSVAQGGEVAAALEDFLALERAGWKGRAGTAIASETGVEAFVREMSERSAPQGALAVHRLELGGRTIAAMLELSAGSLRIPWKIAHDPVFAKRSPGAQLLLEAIKGWLAEPRVARVDPVCEAYNPLAGSLMPDREDYATRILALDGRAAIPATLLAQALDARQRLKNAAPFRAAWRRLRTLTSALGRRP